ncbi:MAG: ribonuclease HII [Aquificaceae bacterium]|nr:ribonuclease HII [Aquificaceae bacterium]MCX7989215.1 ribonuclease HII [Aquificaceae bacterium]MDW8294832.1 ribonuclease HII [Aquificaceae bacterium]
MREYEELYWSKGLLVAGVDEAGRGPLAGPLVACAVILQPFTEPFIDKDSKAMTPKEREEAYQRIRMKALAIGTAVVDSSLIDRIGILRANQLAFKRAIEDLKHAFHLVISDYLPVEGYECLPLVKGDKKSLSCACASVVAKVLRDRIMEYYHRLFPQYNFAKHKGYATKEHIKALNLYRESPIHRKSFSPVKQLQFFG